MTELDASVLRIVRGLRGVAVASFLEDRDRTALKARATPTSADNRGMVEALAREETLCLFKDASFRPPPEPTLLLVDDSDAVIGREILATESEPAPGPRLVHLGKDFVLFGDLRPKGRLRFLLPPVRFPELEGFPGADRVVSASPDTPQDEYLRERFHVPGGKELASVVVGFDRRNP